MQGPVQITRQSVRLAKLKVVAPLRAEAPDIHERQPRAECERDIVGLRPVDHKRRQQRWRRIALFMHPDQQPRAVTLLDYPVGGAVVASDAAQTVEIALEVRNA